MKEELVSFKTAKLAKEKGFNAECDYFYNCRNTKEPKLDSVHPTKRKNHRSYTDQCTAPTQSLLQKWIRGDKKIMVYCVPVSKDHSDFVLWDYQILDWTKRYNIIRGGKSLYYEEALEVGLQEALKLI